MDKPTLKKQLPDIFKYLDFKKYLEDYRQKRKEIEPGFSHSYICYRLGQKNSKSYFANVIAGIKPVTQEFINRFIELLELNTEESQYFRALVNYNQAFNSSEKQYYFEQLLQQNSSSSRLITQQEYSFYKDWYHGVIRAILDIYDFDDDYKKLSSIIKPAITPAQARSSIELLSSLNLIKKDQRGFYKPTDRTIKTEDYVNDELVKHYQLNCLEIAKLSLLDESGMLKDFSTNSLSISEEGLKKIQMKLQKFRDEIRALVYNDTKPADRVYQLDIQLYPHSILLNQKSSSKTGPENAQIKS